jgi:hypothetical protein
VTARLLITLAVVATLTPLAIRAGYAFGKLIFP